MAGRNGRPDPRRPAHLPGHRTRSPSPTRTRRSWWSRRSSAFGGDRISSVAVLKYYSDLAQSAYNTLFNISASATHRRLITSANSTGRSPSPGPTASGSTKIETWNSGGYAFEGYNVWQFPVGSVERHIRRSVWRRTTSSTRSRPSSMTQYDEETGYVVTKPVQFGTDFGIKRSYLTSTDAIGKRLARQRDHLLLRRLLVQLQSARPPRSRRSWKAPRPSRRSCPSGRSPGTRYSASAGDTLKNIVHSGPSDGKAHREVLNPTAMKKEGATYKMVFFGTGSEPDLEHRADVDR